MYKKFLLYVKNVIKLCLFALIGVVLLMLRYILRTPQPLESVLPGEGRLYKWTYGQVYYHVFGPVNAPPLVLLHTPGPGASSFEMRYVMPKLAQTYRVYALDLLGFGLSDHPTIDYTPVIYSTLLRDFLSQIVKQPATLLASGISGGYCVAVAAQAPGLCTGVILLSPLATAQTPLAQRVLALVAQFPILNLALYSLISMPFVMSMLIAVERRPQESDLAYYLAVAQQLNAHRASLAYIAGKLDNKNALAQLHVMAQPVLELWGTRTLQDRQSASLNRIPTTQVQVVLLRDAGKYIQEEQPELVVKHVLEWQDSVRARTAQSAPVRVEAASLQGNKTADTGVVTGQHPGDSGAVPLVECEEQSEHPREAQAEDEAASVDAYCAKCKQKRSMLNPQRIVTKKGRNALEGTCSVCGTRLFRFIANQ